jgi:hypothetical protein
LLLGTRDLGEVPLVIWCATSRRARRARTEQPSANVPGKVATATQFAAVLVVLWSPAHGRMAVYLAAVAGAVAAASYWRRALAMETDAGTGPDAAPQ